MGMSFAFLAVIALILIAWLGVGLAGLRGLFGVVVPYLAVISFILGVVYRLVDWARSPVPFRIPTTAGQMKTDLPFIKSNELENPSSTGGVVGRMILEILLFRSLFRNTRTELRGGPKLDFTSSKWLWFGAIVFHYAFLVTLLRHLRFFIEPVPGWVNLLEKLDGFFEMGLTPFEYLPGLMISGVVLLLAVIYLYLRRAVIPQLRYISLANDYFPLFLIMAIAFTGILMRYFLRVDVVYIKELAMGLVSFQPRAPEGISVWFYIHLFLVSCLFGYFPFSKLVHAPGVFLSPTRNMANTNRAVRHVNPWDYPVKVHSYEAYEDEFRERMVEAGLPVDKPLPEPEEPPAPTEGGAGEEAAKATEEAQAPQKNPETSTDQDKE